MSRPIVIVLGLVVLVAAAGGMLLALSTEDPSPDVPKEGAPKTGTTDAAPKTAPPEDAASRANPEGRAVPKDDVRAVAGTVRSETGDPVPGAVVECYRVAEGEPDDEVRLAQSLLGDVIPSEDLKKLIELRGARPAARATVRTTIRAGRSGRAAEVEATPGSDAPAQDPGELMRIGLEVGGKLMSDPSLLPKLQRVMQAAGAQIEDDAKLPLLARTTSGAGGSFRLEGLDPGRVELRVTAPRFRRAKSRAKVGDLELEIALGAAGLVAGEVRSTGRPLPGATVRLRTRTVVTGPDGRFAHDGATPPKEPVLVSAPGHVGAGAWARVATDGEPELLVVDLEPAATIRGRVTTRAGEPVAGATVGIGGDVGALMTMFIPQMQQGAPIPAPLPQATTGPDGTYELVAVRSGKTDLRCERSGFLAASLKGVRTVARETIDGADFVLVRESGLEGTVRDASGAPVAGATVKVAIPAEGILKQAATFFGGVFSSSRSGPDGRYRTGGVPAGQRDVIVEAAGFLTQRSEETLAEEELLRRDFTLRPGFELGGVVLRPDGTPAAGATVRVQSATATASNPMLAMLGAGGPSFVADAEGKWHARGLQDGPHQVTANAPGFIEASARDVANGTMDLAMTLGAGVTLRGRVVAAEGGAAVAGARVFRKGRTPGRGPNPFMGIAGGDPSVTTAADGTFEISGILPGPWELYGRAKGYAESGRLKVSGGAGDVLVDLVVTLPPGSSLSGRVLRRGAGTPVEGAVVYVPLGRGPLAGVNPSDFTDGEPSAPPDSESAKTAADGTFTIAGLTPGQVTLEARASGLAPVTVAGTAVPGAEVVVEMSEGGALEGVVFAEDGRVREGVTVLAQRGMGGVGARMANTDREGRWRIDRLPAAGHQLILLDPESPSGFGGMAAVTIRDGETTTHDFGKPGTGRPVSGTVVRDGKPVAGATLVLLGGTAGMRLAESDASGGFRFATVPAGDYTVSVQSEAFGGGSTSVRVSVAADADPAPVRLEMSSLAVEGTVVDGETGKPVAMCQVLLLAGSSGRDGSLQDLMGRQKGRTFTGDDGKFRMESVPAGTFTLRVTAAGFAEASVGGVAAGGTPVRVEMSRGLELAVTVLGPDEKPVGSATVVPVDAGGEEGYAFDFSMSKTTGTDGVARLRLPAGRWSLQVRAAGFPEAEVVADAGQGAVSVRLEGGGVLEATVREAGGAPVAGAAVRLLDAAGAEIRPSLHLGNLFGGGATTDAAGRITRDGLRPGRVTVVVLTPSGREARAEANVVAGAVTKVDVAVE